MLAGFSFANFFHKSEPANNPVHHVENKSVSFGRSLSEMNLKYKSGATIGSGGFGKVYSGFRRTDKHPVAIKVVSAKKVLAWRTIKGVQVPLEVAMHSKVQHLPGVVSLLDHYQAENGNHVMILERPEPVQDLFDFITHRGPLDEFIARVFLKQIVETVYACHQNGICHRDIKDENILVDMHTGKCYLIDFGSSEEYKNEPYEGYDAGTKVYCPPEWVKSGSFHPEAGTVWSIGILLYDMLCGDIPFESEDEILSGQLNWRHIGCKISERAKDLIRKCLAYRPENRLTLEGILHHPWLAQCKFDENFAYYFQSYCQRKSRSKMPSLSSPISVPSNLVGSYSFGGFSIQKHNSPLSPSSWTFDCNAAQSRTDSLDSQGNSSGISSGTSLEETTAAC